MASAATDRERRRRVRRGIDLLLKRFGRPRLGRRYPPLDELVLTILSQHTSDVNRDRAYAALRRRFPTWEGVLRADRGELEEAIRPGGLARTKSRVIQDVLRAVKRDLGRLDLDVLKRLPVEEARAFLRRLRGVGEKTVCCVLLFACGRPAFPVDTHVHRVTKRLGWIPDRATAARAHAALASLVPEERYLDAHINLIRLGRSICRARAPECPRCPLRSDCRFAARRRQGIARPGTDRARPPAGGPRRSRMAWRPAPAYIEGGAGGRSSPAVKECSKGSRSGWPSAAARRAGWPTSAS